jgi:uncharacterized membrane protein YfcA
VGLNGRPAFLSHRRVRPLSDLLDPSHLATVLADRRFAVAAVIALVSGAARGFSGFGSAMIYIPLVAAVYEPRVAAATMVLIDLICAFPLAVRAVPHCNWREVVPIGTWVLLVADPVMLRWAIAGVVIVLLAVLASGWRYHGRPRLPATIGVGFLSGLGSGAVQIAGPPVILYWLGGAGQAAFVRANLMVYFTFIDVIGCVAYFRQGLFTREVAVLSLLLGLPFIFAMVAGARWFGIASERSFRRVAYAIIAVSALLSLPLFDSLLR